MLLLYFDLLQEWMQLLDSAYSFPGRQGQLCMRHSLTVASLLVHSAAAFALLERTPSLQHVLQDVAQSSLRPAACPVVSSPRLARCVHIRYAAWLWRGTRDTVACGVPAECRGVGYWRARIACLCVCASFANWLCSVKCGTSMTGKHRDLLIGVCRMQIAANLLLACSFCAGPGAQVWSRTARP